jgi:hypothetical protein
MQAQDGAMHIVLWPANESSQNSYPVYSRDTKPQPALQMKEAGNKRVPLTQLAQELCVLP